MKRFAVLSIVVFTAVASVNADMVVSMRGDDDGFGSGTPLSPGDEFWTWPPTPADPDGFDGYGIGTTADPDFVWTHTFAEFSTVTAGTLYIQMLDFPESGAGDLWIDGVKTGMRLATVPLDQTAPWTVYGNTFDLTDYLDTLADGFVTFAFSAAYDDAWSLDYAKLTIEGTLAPEPVPAPGALLLGALGLSMAGCRLRRKTA